MTARFIDLDTGAVRETTDAQFFEALFGRPPRSKAQLAAEAAAYWAEQRKRVRAEIERLRDNLCALASPELAAKWRAKWAAEDAADAARERRAP